MLPVPVKPVSTRVLLLLLPTANFVVVTLKESSPSCVLPPRVLGISHRISAFVRETVVELGPMPMPAVSSTMSNGVGVPGFCTNWKNVLADAGTAARSANVPRTDNLFAIFNASAPRHNLTRRAFFHRSEEHT